MDNYTGKRLDGRYEIQEVVGVGGMAVVYKAYDNIDDRTVAVKILKEEYLANEEFRRRFKNESKAIAVLSHPNIVKVFNVSYGDRLQYIVMEYVEGITLKEYIEQQGRLGIKETVHFTMQILRALQHAHDKGIVHRDIKPQNIMLLSNGNIKVTDFGIARFSYSDTKTMTDSAIGSVHYISPEQARGDTTDNKADIYSVGVVMYEMLTGQLPFQSDNSVSVALMQLQSDPKNPRELNSSIPVGLEQIVMHAMQKNTKDRYQSAAEMLLEIEEFKRNPTIRFQQAYFVDSDPTKFVTNKPSAVPPIKPIEKINPPVSEDDFDENVDEADGGRSKKSLIAIGVGIGLLVVSVIVFGLLYFFTDIFKKDSLVVPNFVDKIYAEEIENNPKYEHFNIKVVPVANSHYAAGKVFAQTPGSGQVLKDPDTEITLSVASTNMKLVVTDVYGMQYQLAVDTLESKGFKVNNLPMLSTTETFGTVIKTEPERNTEAEVGSVITIYYASDEDLISVPNVVDLEVSMAQALIESVESGKLIFDTNITEENSDKPAGTVISQIPAAEEKVYPGSRVSVVVSNGIPASSIVEIPIILPSSGSRGNLEIYVNNEYAEAKTLLFDGSPYTVKVEGSGADASVKIFADNKEYYSCTVDFTLTPAVIINGSYSSSAIISTRKQIPDVQGLSIEEAERKLKNQGFYNIGYESTIVYSSDKDGIVLSQSPSPSSSSIIGIANTYPIDTRITLTVGQKDGI